MPAFTPHATGDIVIPADQWVMVIPHIGHAYPPPSEDVRYSALEKSGARSSDNPIKIFASSGNIALRPATSTPDPAIPAEDLSIQVAQGNWHVDDLPASTALYARALLIPGTDASVHISC